MTTFRTQENAQDLLRSLRARLDHIERHRHPTLEAAVADEGTRPKPPTDVTYDYMTAAGAPAVRTSWDPPTENVDETPLTDLSHYEVEHQVGGELLYDDPTAVAPTRPHTGLNGLHDTRGTEGVVRGSSGASVRSPDGRDLWLWSDALVGAVDGNGSLLEVDRVHNAASWTLGMAQQGDLLGASNLLEGLTLQLAGATAASDGSFTVDGYASTALTATAATVQGYFDVPVVPGQRYALMAHHQSAGQSIGWEFRDAGVLSSGSRTITAGRNALLTDAAPANASTLRFLVFSATGRTAGQVVSRFVKAGVFTSDHLMLSWRAPASVEQYTNVFTNPEGRGITPGTYSQLVATNRSANPSFLTGTTGLTGLNSATVSRVVSPSAFAGFAHGRIRRAAAGNNPIFRLASSAVAPGLLTARFRVRRAAPLGSATSTLTVVAQALATSTVLASSPAQVLELDDDWQVVELQVTGPATTNALRVEASASGTAWVASDQVDVDGVEFYQGESPPFYFDGSTSPRDGYVFAWTGTAGSSTSTMTATSTRRINHFRNPRLTSTTSITALSGATRTVTGNAIHVTATAAGQGVRLTHSTSFPVGATISASVLLRGTGVVRLAINGTPVTLSEPLTLSPGEDRRLSLTMMTTATTTASVDVLAQGAASFTVREPLVEQGLAGDFFHGASTLEDRVVSWEGTVDASRSIASAPTPTGWAPVDATRERLVYDDGMVEVTALKDTSTLRARVSSTALTAGSGTVTATVEAPAGVTVQLEGAFSNASTALSPVILPGDRVRHVFTVPAGATSTRFDVIFTGSFAGGDSVRLGAVTLVQGAYLGPPFTGEMDATEGAAAAWDGTPHASTSELTLDAADQYLDDRPVSLVAATDAGLPPSHFLRAEDAVVLGSTAYVFMTGYVPLPSASEGFSAVRTGKTYLASFDLATGTYLDVAEWAAPSAGVWGTAVATDGTWLYVYGLQAGSVQVARTSLADPYTVTYWGGSSWVSSGTPAVVAVGTDGFHGVRQIGTDWVALEIPAPGEALHKWSAVAPQGPFSDDGAQQTWTGLPRRQPRFHPQFDAVDQGIVVSTIDDDAIRFTSGPPGTAHPSFDYEIWGDRQSVVDPVHYTLDIERGTPYRVRVRAVADTGRFSDWALGDAEVYWPEDPLIQRPAAPVVEVLFRGARVYWPGTDVDGDPYEGFLSYRLHMSTEAAFEPAPQNLVATSTAPGGVNYIAVDDYRTYYVMVVVETRFGFSDPSETVSFTGERLSDPDLAQVLIDGAKIAKGTLNLEALTVGSFGNSMVANPGFEVPRPDDASRPVAWSAGFARQPGGGALTPEQAGDYRLDTSTVLEGGKSLRIDTLAASSVQVISDPFPIAAGDIYYVAARMRTSSLTADVKITLKMGTTREDVNAEPATAFSQTATVYTSTGTFTTVHAEGQVEVPDGDGLSEPMHWGAVSIEALHTGTAYSTWVDSVEVRQIVGTASIANASINNAKIADLAVDDAKIAWLDAGKIVTGFLDADRIEAGSLTISQVGGLGSELAQKTTTFAQDAVPTSTAIGDLWVDTNDGNTLYRAASVGTSTVGIGHWEEVAQEIAGSTLTFTGPSVPVSSNVGDLWFDTDDGNKMYRAASAGADQITTGEWEAVAPVSTLTFAQDAPPVSKNIGDLWIDTNDNNRMYRAASVGADQVTAGEWVSIAPSLVMTTTFAQDDIPTSLHVGDLWIDTNDGNKLYRAAVAGATTVGAGAWVPVSPSSVVPMTTFAQPAIPTSQVIGDLWVDTDDGNKLYRAAAAGVNTIGAGAWVLVSSPTVRTFAQTTAPVSVNIGDLWVNTTTNLLYRAASIGADSVNAGEWELVDSPNTRTFAQTSIPTSITAGDLWIDTDDQNKMYRAAAAGVSTIGAGAWVALPPVTTQTYAQPSPPVAKNIGDLWVDTDDLNKFYRAASVGADEVAAGEWVLVETPNLTTFAQPGIPTSILAGDLWIDTDDDNKMYRAYAAGVNTIGATGWVALKPAIIRTFAQPGIPTSVNPGDLWVDTDDNNKMYRAYQAGVSTIGATGWVLVESKTTTTFAQSTVPVAQTAGDLWVHTGKNNQLYRAVVAGADQIAAGEWVLVAQPTTVTFAQASIPVAQNIGDVWVDTDDGNKMYRALSIGADAIAAGEWVSIDNTAFAEATTIVNGWRVTGKTTIDGGKIETDSITAGQIQLGVLRSNMVADPSFEESYDLSAWDPFGSWAGEGWTDGNTGEWRKGNPNGGSVERDHSGTYARSGSGAIVMTTLGATSTTLVSNAMKVQIGSTYRVLLNAAVVSGVVAPLNVQVMSNSGPTFDGFQSQTLTADESYPSVPVVTAPLSVDAWQTRSYVFTASNEWVAIRLINNLPTATSVLVVEDVSMVEVGIGGASEVTSAGLRLFDDDGYESGAFVNNRPSFFSVSSGGVQRASISSSGDIVARGINVPERVVDVNGDVTHGAYFYGRELQDLLDERVRVIARGVRTTAPPATSGTTSVFVMQVGCEMRAGRSYRFSLNNARVSNSYASGTGASTILGLTYKIDGTNPNDGSPNVGKDRWVNHDPSSSSAMYADAQWIYDATQDIADFRAALYYKGLLGSASFSSVSGISPLMLLIEDLGPTVANTASLTAGVPRKRYFKTWLATGFRNFNQNGTQITGLTRAVHGPQQGNTSNNRYSVVVFGGSEPGQTIAQALSGTDVIVHGMWIRGYPEWYGTSGKATIRAFNSLTLPTSGTSTTGTAVQTAEIPDGWPLLIDITDIASTSLRGVILGADGTTNLSNSGTFPTHLSETPLHLVIEYSKVI